MVINEQARVLMRRDALAEYLGVSPQTVDKRLKDMQKEIPGRYSEKVITKIGGIKVINVLAFTDYIHYKEQLDDRHTRKYVPPYNPSEWAYELGIIERSRG